MTSFYTAPRVWWAQVFSSFSQQSCHLHPAGNLPDPRGGGQPSRLTHQSTTVQIQQGAALSAHPIF